ncbi:peptide deformylase [Nostoc linckia z18]|uniref:Peptide deformylase n=4 Tax=Nostoc TaxID=1177 RepID=A0A9Q5ZBB1_NOSLI|nr:peptide deformylase [Nostoc linckia z3]PHJ68789.1 peptide deformylase [Nostoc linckia z1]PHJ74079.1 peptide deformylase [Nostoc linckia z2]PHJ84052.1 peptide deformylase [Nostoc linckia z4]PHJ91556.1 peptide deformylase [Nostoc linckia z6]PHJ95384.1 peptide deformylase [Nostoc linckia z7]PHK02716.1 peptide deformylase [Nostoc linckia z8]PHK09070.1 peptide deformylase [Nostoc linckia z9]PHK17281.1 peptide deformylase [Nostoc linckia z14]PHK25593.1 peptide deformylase [Nostoc linckia z13]
MPHLPKEFFMSQSIIQLGNPTLRQKAAWVDNIQDPSIQKLIDDLMSTVATANGVGIAAPQVAQSYRLFIVASRPNARYPNAPEMEPTAMINPRIIGHSKEVVKDWEGCLSVPGIRGLVPRYKNIEVEYSDRQGNVQKQELRDFVARIFQHEYDHLDGIVFVDRLENTLDMITEQEYQQRVVNKT